MDLEKLPPQLRDVVRALAAAMRSREPGIRHKVDELRAANPQLSNDDLARKLIGSTRYRVAATGAATGAAAIAPGLGTLISLGAATGQAVYALEQETELVLAISIVYGHELTTSDQRLLEALVVVGIAGEAVKLREDFLFVGGQRLAIAAFRRLPAEIATRAGCSLIRRILMRAAGSRAVAAVGRAAPLAIGMVVGAGFDWIAVSALGRAAMRYYGPGGPASRWPQLTAGREDLRDVVPGN